MSILNGHNFGPERRTEILKKQFEVRSESTSWISEPNFARSIKFGVMSHNNQSGKFFYITPSA